VASLHYTYESFGQIAPTILVEEVCTPEFLKTMLSKVEDKGPEWFGSRLKGYKKVDLGRVPMIEFEVVQMVHAVYLANPIFSRPAVPVAGRFSTVSINSDSWKHNYGRLIAKYEEWGPTVEWNWSVAVLVETKIGEVILGSKWYHEHISEVRKWCHKMNLVESVSEA